MINFFGVLRYHVGTAKKKKILLKRIFFKIKYPRCLFFNGKLKSTKTIIKTLSFPF